MDLKTICAKSLDYIKKYRYVLLMLIIGLLLMALPGSKNSKSDSVKSTDPEIQMQVSVNEQLSNILSKLDGAGKVEVLLTIAHGEETIFQTDDKVTETDQSNTTQIDTVTVTDAERNQAGLIRQINPPTYLGAVILCQGADSAAVRLLIVDAVSKVTGLGADQISVLKMK